MNLFDKIIFHLNIEWINLFYTLVVNFKCLPLKHAVKLPILIYGKMNCYWSCGKIEILSDKISHGMIKWGRNTEFFNGNDKSSFLYFEKGGRIIFHGPCAISSNYRIRVANGGTLEFGAYTFFGSNIKFICTDYIYIGDYTRCAYESQLVDTNSHYVLNMNKGVISKRNGIIYIGRYNWIGNRSTINKGCKTKDYTIIGTGSLLNKDYTQEEDCNQMLAGIPAKQVAANIKRIFNTQLENTISNYFSLNPTQGIYKFSDELVDDMSSIHNWFHKIM